MLVRKFIQTIVLLPVLGFVLFNIVLYYQQPGMLFYPLTRLDAAPSDWGLAYEDVYLTTPDNIKIHGWYVPKKSAKQVVLFFHGNGGNIAHRGDSLKIFHQLGVSTLIIDYRGYGRSEGKPDEQGMYLDARAAWDYLTGSQGFQPQDVIIFGRSIGGAVATQLASQVKPRALILESTFSSVEDMASIYMPGISRLIYMRYQFDTAARISQVKAPLLLMHSQDDDVIPYILGLKVFEAANRPKYSYELVGDHNTGFLNSMPGYAEALSGFLELL